MQHDELDQRVVRTLCTSLPLRADVARHGIMSRIHALRDDERPRRGSLRSRAVNFRASVAGAVLAAGIGSVGALPSIRSGGLAQGPETLATVVIGDTVSATLRDTMRLVRLMFVDPHAHAVAVVGSFHGWQPDSTPLTRSARTSQWSVTIAVHDREPRFAVLVDGARWAVDRSIPPAVDRGQRLYTLLRIAPIAN